MGYDTVQPGMRVRKFWTNIVFVSSRQVELEEVLLSSGQVNLEEVFISSGQVELEEVFVS